MQKRPMRPTLPATFTMKRGGKMTVLLEVGYEPPDQSVGIMQENYYPDRSAWIETKSGYRNMDWIFDHSNSDPEIEIPQNFY